MNILHLTPSNNFSGAEKVILLLSKYNTEDSVYVGCGIGLKNIYIEQGIKTFSLDFNNKLATLKKIKEIVIKEKIDIIHAHDNIASIMALLSKYIYRLDVKIISHIHNSYQWLTKLSLYKFIDRLTRNKYDFNIYCGKTIKEFYEENARYIDFNKTDVVSNCIEIDSEKSDENLREELGIEKKFVYGFIGRLTEQKGILPLIQELANWKDEFKDCIFLILGEGVLRKEIDETVKINKMGDIVKIVGFKSDIIKYYDIMDVFFLPSLYEGLPMVVLESMSKGKVVVSTNVGSISEVIENKVNGILIEKGDTNKFIEALRDVKNDGKLRREICIEAKKLIKQEYSIEKQIRSICEIYKTI